MNIIEDLGGGCSTMVRALDSISYWND